MGPDGKDVPFIKAENKLKLTILRDRIASNDVETEEPNTHSDGGPRTSG